MLSIRFQKHNAFWLIGVAVLFVVVGGYVQNSHAQDNEEGSVQLVDSQTATHVSQRGSEVVIHVRDGQGRLVNGVPVVFQLMSNSAKPIAQPEQRAIIRNGTARVSFGTDLSGVDQIQARVGSRKQTDAVRQHDLLPKEEGNGY